MTVPAPASSSSERRRLPVGARTVVAAAWASNIGDGIRYVSLPLLAATLTDSATAIGAVLGATMLPGALLGAPIGVLVDRFDRRRAAIAADLTRVVVAVALTMAVAFGFATMALVFAAALLLGIGETFRDLVGAALIADAVDGADLEAANGGLVAAEGAGNMMVGPLGGAALWSAGQALPFLCDAVALTVSARTTSKLARQAPNQVAGSGTRLSLRRELSAAWLLVLRHQHLRRVAGVSFLMMFALMSMNGVEVLWALERLDIGPVGFGALNAVGAVGGILVSLRMGPVVARIPPRSLVPAATAVTALGPFVYATTTNLMAVFALVLMSGVASTAADVTLRAARVRAAGPTAVGRVSGVLRTVLWSGGIVGTVVGGAVADRSGLVSTFKMSFVVLAVTATLAALWSPIPGEGDVTASERHAG